MKPVESICFSPIDGANGVFANSPPTPDTAKILETLKEKRQPSLGELNPLLFPPDLDNPEAIEALSLAISQKIAQYSGKKPDLLQTVSMLERYQHEAVLRLIVRFSTDQLTEEQINYIEQVAILTYGKSVKTRVNSRGTPYPTISYPDYEKSARQSKQKTGKYLGWYFGTEFTEVETTDTGVLVFRDLGEEGMARYLDRHPPKEWFFKSDLVTPMGKPISSKYFVEIREADLYQTDLVELIVQISRILAHGTPVTNPLFKYEIYNDLNRLGLRRVGKENIYGLDEVIDRLERVLILPLANLRASSAIDLRPGSALLVGVPGTGKTLLAEHLLSLDTGVFLLPIEAGVLAAELAAPPVKKRILPRISRVSQDTGLPVILHVDDIEGITENDQLINSALLNLLAGVREQGFYLLTSTNHPEKLKPELIQPQRLEHVIHLGLPDQQTRLGILNVHATKVSRELNLPLFRSEGERSAILETLALNTEGFTSRYLAAICNMAKAYFIERVSRIFQQSTGLTEEQLQNNQFTPDDWINAYEVVNRSYPKKQIVDADQEIKAFVGKVQESLGFTLQREKVASPIRDQILARLSTLEEASSNQSEQPEPLPR